MRKANLLLTFAAFLLVALSASAQRMDTRAVVERTQHDIRRSLEFERHHGKGKELTRYDNAEHHLSEFDRELSRGHFDKDKLDQAIDDVKNLVENNTLDPDSRDAITADLRDLRMMRSDYDHRH